MAKLPIVSGLQAVKAFSRLGWSIARQTGSHLIMERVGNELVLSIPQRAELKRGLLRQLINDAGLTVDQFLDAL